MSKVKESEELDKAMQEKLGDRERLRPRKAVNKGGRKKKEFKWVVLRTRRAHYTDAWCVCVFNVCVCVSVDKCM